MGKDPFKIRVITNNSIPYGMAATNRILSYAQQLARKVSVKIYITKPTENINLVLNKEPAGQVNKVLFEYVNGYTVWPYESTKLKKFLIIIKGYYKTINRLKEERPNVIIVYTSDFFIRVLLLLMRFMLGYKLVFEENEYPKLQTLKNKFYNRIYLFLYRYTDGMIVMTKELYNYYGGLKVHKILLLPMTVDIGRFSKIINNPNREKYFAYCGDSGGFKRDGVFDMIKAFHLFSKIYPLYKLLIIGPVNKEEKVFMTIESYINEKNLSERVLFIGKKPSFEIPKLLTNATGLIMTPPENFQSGGFPTKLGEFLASGTPVICTKVGEIPVFLDETNAFLVDPGNIEEISNAMLFIAENPGKSYEIGVNGKELAQKVFNPDKYYNDLLSFLKKI